MIEAAVVDASVAIKWVVEESGSDRARRLSLSRLVAPDLLLVECANILWKKVRLRDLTDRNAADCLELLQRAPVELTGSSALLAPALMLAVSLHHPVYDCVYLALALSRNFPLVTADERLVGAVRRQRKMAAHVMSLAELKLDNS